MYGEDYEDSLIMSEAFGKLSPPDVYDKIVVCAPNEELNVSPLLAQPNQSGCSRQNIPTCPESVFILLGTD